MNPVKTARHPMAISAVQVLNRQPCGAELWNLASIGSGPDASDCHFAVTCVLYEAEPHICGFRASWTTGVRNEGLTS